MLASLITQHTVKFAGCDKLNSSVIKTLGEYVANGYPKIAFIIDTSSIENDNNYIAFAAALASGDIEYIKSLLTMTDLRTLLSKY